MGCSINSRLKRVQTAEAIKIDAQSSKEIKLAVSSFCHENLKSFSDVFRLGPMISHGPYSEIHTCTNRETNIKRCVKIYRKDLLPNETVRTSIVSQIEIQKSLDHPNVVKIFEFFENVKRIHVIYELCSGGDLSSEIPEGKYLPEAKAAKVIEQLLLAVSFMHEHNIMHRTLRPECILLEEAHNLNTLKVFDFEHASRIDIIQPLVMRSGIINYISPEALDCIYNEKSDIWSIGVILYLLLSGSLPFNGKSDEEVAQSIRKGKINIIDSPWDKISEEAKKLILRMICPMKKRITAEQALTHAWFSKGFIESSHDESVECALSSLKNFVSSNKLKDAVHMFIASHCTTANEIKSMREAFQAIDKNGDGKLSKEELLENYILIGNIENAEEEVNRIISQVDSDGSGFIDYTEFLKATIDKKKFGSIENLKKSFDLFDRDMNGSISVAEIKEILEVNSNTDDTVFEDIIKEFDKNGDGVIDLEEFCSLILSKI